jgi:hypothetical protein
MTASSAAESAPGDASTTQMHKTQRGDLITHHHRFPLNRQKIERTTRLPNKAIMARPGRPEQDDLGAPVSAIYRL